MQNLNIRYTNGHYAIITIPPTTKHQLIRFCVACVIIISLFSIPTDWKTTEMMVTLIACAGLVWFYAWCNLNLAQATNIDPELKGLERRRMAKRVARFTNPIKRRVDIRIGRYMQAASAAIIIGLIPDLWSIYAG